MPRRTRFPFFCGFVTALIFMELLLHPFSGGRENSAGKEVRQYREGLTQAHFTPDWRRLTGSPQIAGAPSVVILGDSHVEAWQVWDQETMGSVLERRLRTEGKPWNVLQYGWNGADGPDYVYEAPLVAQNFPSNNIFLLMNAGDFRSTTTKYARLVEQDGKVAAEATGPDSVRGNPRLPSKGFWARTREESGLYLAIRVRWIYDISPSMQGHAASTPEDHLLAEPASQNALPLIVRGLQQAYGDRLHILYTPTQPFSEHESPEPQESELLVECKALGMACRSLRSRMEKDLIANHRLARGFSNSEPGVGHFNARGHQLVADELHDWLNDLD